MPAPSAHECARSEALAAQVRADITRAGGAIPFARFMELALYAPALGYYSGGAVKFGEAGDFVTAPELGSVFARCLARQCAQVLELLGGADILEAGAGSGALAADLLLELEKLGQLPGHYFFLELSADLRARQRDALQQRAPHLAARAQWLDRLPERFRGVVLGNELLDAIPVERFRVTPEGVCALHVASEGERFVWRERPAGEALRRRVAPLGLAPGYESEVGFAAEGWVRSIADWLESGIVLLIDYGFPRAEFYHPQRAQGTLMCHYRHRAHGDPLVLLGLQDITAHIDFTAIANAGREAGLEVLGYASQAMFLLGCGIEELVREADSGDTRAFMALTQQIKRLTSPAEMGELFKVIALGRDVPALLSGFSLQDRRARL